MPLFFQKVQNTYNRVEIEMTSIDGARYVPKVYDLHWDDEKDQRSGRMQSELIHAEAAETPAAEFTLAALGINDPEQTTLDVMLRADIPEELIPGLFFQMEYFQSEEHETLLRTVLENSPQRAVRGHAALCLARFFRAGSLRLSGVKNYLRMRSAGDQQPLTPENQRIMDIGQEKLLYEAERYLDEVLDNYADVQYAEGRTLGAVAQEMKQLSLGQVAPEIEGEDVYGKSFRLSDYRGKVVVLSFSGNWCVPCVAMYPREWAFVEQLKGHPFALLGINTDEDKSTLKKSINAGKVTWRCWWDGGQNGPITETWQVQAYPSVVVLDHKGIIRYRNILHEEIDEAVQTLLAEMRTDHRR